MPSIEIVCINQVDPLEPEERSFAVEAENRLISHRSPSPLFQPDFDRVRGCIYHLGNPELRFPNNFKYFRATSLLCKEPGLEWWEMIYFAQEFVPGVRRLLEQLVEASPVGLVLFTSDYQFGPSEKRYKRPLSLERFWRLHDERKLKMNALYPLKR